MPCSDPRDSISYVENRHSLELEEARRTENRLRAIICALNSAIKLVAPTIYDQVIATAETNGKIDIRSYIEEHDKYDAERLETEIRERYSSDELQVIRKILLEDDK